MKSLWNIRNRQASLAFMLVCLVLLVSFGSRSYAFHQWTCGDEVQCVLEYDSACCEDHEPGDTSNEKNSKSPDPLQPFCQSGINVQIDFIDTCPYLISVTYLPELAERSIHSNDFAATSHSRAPPILV